MNRDTLVVVRDYLVTVDVSFGIAMPKTVVTPFVASEYLDSEETIDAYLATVTEENDPELLRRALEDVETARARLRKGATETPDAL
ncbi:MULTISPECIES: helix-turn-helix domain-containing transcriptional regulator [Paraburkholderia]|uniref:helix-turn-helix domain-containing transcriptional regulator n=1 Tax=Paraburkholderia TaxID=1822464 RepID=UPI0022542EB5|nr:MULTISPECIES: hypothetical protein [Paraburkholderia]MCX4156170.1 hypothetical protein [Paraburkholderia aspalathi]MDN7165576.1 hypothetical protein [Paraburkholderia sp. SECH2]MDQ6394062.1 hypothetical protein [Paraburkholderia aspalathi]